MIAVFDIGGPLVAYSLLRSAGVAAVPALVLSGVFPAAGVAIGFIISHRADALGVLVLAGMAVGAVLGLVSHDAKLVLLEGSVPTVVFGLMCLGSLWTRRPLMYRLALEFMGPDTMRGRDFAGLWRWPGFQHAFRVLTVVWGVGYLAEAAIRVVIVLHASAGTAFGVSKVLPYVVTGVLAAWTVVYGRYQKRKGDRLAAAAIAAAAAEDLPVPVTVQTTEAEHPLPEHP